MVTLREKSTADLLVWNERIWRLYREELIRAGSSEAAADENVRENLAATMDGEALKPGNFVFDVVEDGNAVGNVWLNERVGEWFIYDIEIFEPHRGQGLGRATMQAIESHVSARGAKEIGLSVFGFNKVAQNLYLSEGYEVTRLSMQKKL